MKKILLAVLAIIMVFGFVGAGIASGKANERKGKYTFRKNCRTCHKDGGAVEALHPSSKTMAQWKRIFDKEKFMDYECKDEWAKVDESGMKDVYAYLYNHAYDSPSPAKCN